MRIACPSCASAYEVPDPLVPVGRIVRCAHCGNEWTPVPLSPARPEPVAPPAVELAADPTEPAATSAAPIEVPPQAEKPQRTASAMDRLAMPSARPASRLPLRLAWLASLALLVALAWCAFAWRSEIVAAWPPSARVYALFGEQPPAGRTQ